MASEAYKRMMNRIPKGIQQKVEFNLDIADEIYKALEQKGIKAADLARLMGKSESEISKWMTGTHNFSIKTIQKIELALQTELMMTKSAKIQVYEEEQLNLKKKINQLELECNRLRTERDGAIEYADSGISQLITDVADYYNYERNKNDSVSLKPEKNSDYEVSTHFATA